MRGRKPQGHSNAQFPFTLSARVNGEEFRLYKDHAAQMGLLTSHWIRIAIANQYKTDQSMMNTDESMFINAPVKKTVSALIAKQKKEHAELAQLAGIFVGVFVLLSKYY